MEKNMNGYKKFFLTLAALFSIAVAMPSQADQRMDEELADSSPAVNPLRFALGAEAYDAAMASGEYKYSGNLKCRLCHREFFLGRKKDPHEHTFKDHIKKGDHAEEGKCLACHTTGFGIPTGFVDAKSTRKLTDVQCEGCHGPGSVHNARDAKGGFLAGTDKPEILKKMCQACHNARWNKSFKSLDDAYKAYKEAEAAAGGL